jgi:hypothetical protein
MGGGKKRNLKLLQMNKDINKIEETNDSYIFYYRKLENNTIVGVTEIEPDEKRQGWLRGNVVDCGNDDKLYIGADYNSSATHIFNSGLYDYGKELSKVRNL